MDPLQPSVVSACSVRAGDRAALNVIPDVVEIGGAARACAHEVRDQLEREIGRRARGVAEMFGIEADCRFIRRIPPVVNAPDATEVALAAARGVCADGERTALPPSPAGDDNAFFVGEAPGAYVWLGNGPAADGAPHHNAAYDFCAAAIPAGVAFWAEAARRRLA